MMNMELDNKCYKGHTLITFQKKVQFYDSTHLPRPQPPNHIHIVDSGYPNFNLVTPSPNPTSTVFSKVFYL